MSSSRPPKQDSSVASMFQSKVFSTLLGLGILVAIFILTFKIMGPFLMAMLWGLIIAFALLPSVDGISGMFTKFFSKIPSVDDKAKPIVITGLFGLTCIIFFIFIIFFFKEFYQDVQRILDVKSLILHAETFFLDMVDKLKDYISDLPEFIASESTKARWMAILSDTKQWATYLKTGLSFVGNKIINIDFKSMGIGTFVIQSLINLYIFILFTLGILLSNPDKVVKEKLNKGFLKKAIGVDFKKLYHDFRNIIELQINVVLENSILQGLLYFLGLWLSGALNFHYCFFLGIVGTVFTLLPAIGISFLIVPTFIVAIIFKQHLLVILMIVAQIICFIDEWYLRQRYARPFSGSLIWLFNLFSKKKGSSFLSDQYKEHVKYEIPAVFYLISQIGAVSIFGLSGFIFGPIFLMLIKVLLWEIFKPLE